VLVSTPKTDADPVRGESPFIVERASPVFSTAHIKLDKLEPWRGSNTCELVFQDCESAGENILSEAGRGVHVLMSGVDYDAPCRGRAAGICRLLERVCRTCTSASQFGSRSANSS